MKKLLAIFLTLSLTVVLAACGGSSDDEIKAVRKVSFDGTELTVTLGTNKSTGYEWDYEIYGDCIKPSINRSFKVSGSKGDATGEVSIGFEGLSEGDAAIVFTTPNGWDGTGGGDGYTVNVEVGADGAILSASGVEGASAPEPTPEPSPEILSAPYAEMLRSGDYQYTYSLIYEDKLYTATIATYNGMICRKVVSDDGAYSQRIVTIDGNAWKVDDLTGAVVDGGTENAETLPDYASTLAFAASKALETGAICDAYDFEYEGKPCNIVFVFSQEGKLVELIMTLGEKTSEMEILNFGTVGNDKTLFDAPQ